MPRRVLSLAVIVLALCGLIPRVGAQEPEPAVRFEGTLDGAQDRIDLSGIEVTVNGLPARSDGQGGFAAEVPLSRYYYVEANGAAIFPTMQTFGNAELRDENCQCLRIPPIELVARRKGRVELFFGGDSMAGRRYFEAGEGEKAVLDRVTLDRDLDRLFTAIRPYFAHSDLASINLESVVAATQPGPPAPKKYLFFSPPELPLALARAGIDHVSLGNNHTADYRAAGLRTTIDALDAAGVAWSGAGMDLEEAERASRFDLGQEKVAIYGFVGWRGTWEPNQTATPTKAGAAWGLASTVRRITVRERQAGYVPIMQFHGNLEYADRPSSMSLPRFRAAIDKGSPLVIGHHPHVTQGLEIYRGGLIAHSLGNFLFDQEHPHTHVTYGLKVWLEDGRFLRAEVVPMQMLDYRPVPAVGGMREAVLRRLYWLSGEMGTTLHQSGGHAAVWARRKGAARTDCAPPARFRLAALAPACPAKDFQFGRNMIPRGDFENVAVGYARDRFWVGREASVDYREAGGNTRLAILPLGAAKPFYVFSKSYIRDVSARRFTLQADVHVPRQTTVTLIAKPRPQGGEEATPSIVGDTVGQVTLHPGEGGPQKLSLDFELPAEQPGIARAFRIILRFDFADGRETGVKTVEMDDLALVEWPDLPGDVDPAQSWRWTHARPAMPLPGG